MNRAWAPRPSEVVLIDFNPVSGHEQANRRPAVVLSHQGFNDRLGLIVCVPVTTKLKGNPFEVMLAGLPERSAALSHQPRTLDWRARQARPFGFASAAEMQELRGKLAALIGA
ncbi:MAG TPA: type II toxin-antitoxin system PemK/MazF family toxin [Alphaproteobacteria bacterium]|nr:type II toxin-antitoxin system PemK/MazF family toxin [Alphaproteobacteria bacterium]